MFGEVKRLKEEITYLKQANKSLKLKHDILMNKRLTESTELLFKIKSILDNYNEIGSSLCDYSHCLSISSDMGCSIYGGVLVNGEKIMTTKNIKSFSNLMSDIIEDLKIEDRLKLYNKIKPILSKYKMSEYNYYSLHRCMLNIEKLPIKKFKNKTKEE